MANGNWRGKMNKNATIFTAAAVVIVVVLFASFIATYKGEDPQEPSIVGGWESVYEYNGGWLEGHPIYSESPLSGQHANITNYKDDFYVFDTGSEKLYCSWDGNKMVTAGLKGSSDVAFISQLQEDKNFLTVSYFIDDKAVIELYKRAGYVGKFPGLSIPGDIPGEGSVIDSYKLREYTEEGYKDIGVNTMSIESVEGRMIFYDVVGTDGYTAEYIGLYLDSGMFLSLGVNDSGSAFEIMQYRTGVFYCSTMIHDTGDIWVTEYGDKSSASYPEKNLYGCNYLGVEDALVFKDGKITEKIFGNAIDLRVLMQDDGCLRIATLDWTGNEDATWTALYYDLRPLHYCGMFVQSSIEYKGVTYHGLYFGQFDSKDCDELYISGLLHGEDGGNIVISQQYALQGTT